MIRTLIVDDSATAQQFLLKALEGQADIEVVGVAANGREAVELANRLRPTLITMDIWMPEMDGFAATEQIMADCPTRIVIVSSGVGSNQGITFDALQAGALEVFPKAHPSDSPGLERYRAKLLSTLRAMAGVTVLRRQSSSRSSLPPLAAGALPQPRVGPGGVARRRFLAIGASTGGPAVLAQLLGALPEGTAFPIAVVQHMAAGFTDGFVRWLQDQTPLRVRLAQEGEAAAPGSVYLAPEGLHLRLASGWTFQVSPGARESQFCPSVDVLFQSVASVAGSGGIGLLLTGMGDDGARGLLELRRVGGLTLAQEGASCVVNGMPAAAAALGAVDHFVRPSSMPDLLTRA